MPTANTSKKTDRFRPLVTDGGIVEGLSLPQHDFNSDVKASQKHHVTLVTAHVRTAAAL